MNKELSRAQQGRYNFWSRMNEYFEDNKVGLRTRKPSYDHWYDFTIGNSNYHLSVNLLDNENRIRVFWYGYHPDKMHYDKLYLHKPEIDRSLSAFGKLEWDRKAEELKASWISTYVPNFSYDNTDNWNELFEAIAERVTKFQEVLKQYL